MPLSAAFSWPGTGALQLKPMQALLTRFTAKVAAERCQCGSSYEGERLMSLPLGVCTGSRFAIEKGCSGSPSWFQWQKEPSSVPSCPSSIQCAMRACAGTCYFISNAALRFLMLGLCKQLNPALPACHAPCGLPACKHPVSTSQQLGTHACVRCLLKSPTTTCLTHHACMQSLPASINKHHARAMRQDPVHSHKTPCTRYDAGHTCAPTCLVAR